MIGFKGPCVVVHLTALLWTLVQPTQENYVIDVLVVMDSKSFNPWISRESKTLSSIQRRNNAEETAKKYISLVVRQANLRLESLTNSNNKWSVRLSVSGFQLGANPLSGIANFLTGKVSAARALATLKIWVATQDYGTKYDYVLLLTGYDLQGASDLPYEVKGIANVGTVCETDGTSIAIVEDRGGFHSVYLVAHEFGHSLGTTHDGESPNTACPDSDRFLMAINSTKVTSSTNPWYFSSCSKHTIGAYVEQTILKNHSDCLKSSQIPDQAFSDTQGMLAGQEFDGTQQCRNIYGSGSRVCLGGNFGDVADICTSMFCLDPSWSSGGFRCFQETAAEGTSCGSGKMCQLGRCLESPRAPKETGGGQCPNGDALVTIEGQFTCGQFVAMRPASCYKTDFQTACCDSCRKIANKDSEACPYGDTLNSCQSSWCKMVDAEGRRLEELCCKTCGYDVTRPCADVERVDGLPCDELVRKNQLQGCYNRTVAYHCCKTCEGLRQNVTGCEYGDLDLVCGGVATNAASCGRFGGQCCHTCANLGSNPGTATGIQASAISLYSPLVVLIMLRVVNSLP